MPQAWSLVVQMIDRRLARQPAWRNGPGGRGSPSSAGFQLRGEKAAARAVPDASLRLRAGLRRDQWTDTRAAWVGSRRACMQALQSRERTSGRKIRDRDPARQQR